VTMDLIGSIYHKTASGSVKKQKIGKARRRSGNIPDDRHPRIEHRPPDGRPQAVAVAASGYSPSRR